MGRKVNATLVTLQEWNKTIQVPQRKQKYGLQKIEKSWILAGLSRGGSQDASTSPPVHPGPLSCTRGHRTTSTDKQKFHPLLHFHHLETRRTTLIWKCFPICSAQLRAGLLSPGLHWAGPPGAVCTPFPSAHNGLPFQCPYYSNAQILLLLQFNVHHAKTFRALVIIYCPYGPRNNTYLSILPKEPWITAKVPSTAFQLKIFWPAADICAETTWKPSHFNSAYTQQRSIVQGFLITSLQGCHLAYQVIPGFTSKPSALACFLLWEAM